MNERFGGAVKGGLVVFDQPTRWRGLLARHEGKRVTVVLQRERHARSLKANAYLWGVVYRTVAEWSGHDDEEIHEAMKAMFLYERAPLLFPTGEEARMPGSTAVLDSVGFSEYVGRVKRWAAENGVYIPEPDEVEVTL